MKTANINGVHIPLLINNRAMVEYERMRNKPAHQVASMEDAIALAYCGLKAGARSAQLKFDMDFEAFIDYTDQHPEIMVKDEAKQDQGTEDDKKKAAIK